ncbi:MAG: hypothetical protein ABJZ55_24245 [Fuerstiella sp.]
MQNRNFSELLGTDDLFADSEGPELTVQQLAALEALLDGKTQKQAAEAAGRSEKWLWHQMNAHGRFRDVFSEVLNSRQRAIRIKALTHAESALDVLAGIAADPKHTDRLKACQAILSHTKAK